ncbi:MAG: DUF6150 family protein [Sulfurifustis sp.]
MARVYQCSNYGEAHIRVAVVDDPGEADLCVHRVSSWGLASGDALWYLTRDKQDATVWLYFDSFGASQVRVCFVDNYTQAGWRRPHPLKGRFG